MDYKQDLQTAFKTIGVSIRQEDVQTILQLGADRYLNQIRFNTTEENLSTIYIILNEMRQASPMILEAV